MREVTVRLIGGLGNQMFQYAAGVGLARSAKAELKLDVSGYASYATWPYLLDRLCVPQNLARSPSRWPVGTSVLARTLRRVTGGGIGVGRVYREPHFHVDDGFFTLEPPVTIDGYFQSPRYFAHVADEVRDAFQLREAMGTAGLRVADLIRRAGSPVAVHVRRGDYVKGAGEGVYADLGEEYYAAAIDTIKGLLRPERPSFFAFSDDPGYAQELLSPLADDITIVRGDPTRPYEDLHLMAMCRHNIIANSTFGWWGAWLNEHPDAITVAPSRWFSAERSTEYLTRDLFPSRWLEL